MPVQITQAKTTALRKIATKDGAVRVTQAKIVVLVEKSAADGHVRVDFARCVVLRSYTPPVLAKKRRIAAICGG